MTYEVVLNTNIGIKLSEKTLKIDYLGNKTIMGRDKADEICCAIFESQIVVETFLSSRNVDNLFRELFPEFC